MGQSLKPYLWDHGPTLTFHSTFRPWSGARPPSPPAVALSSAVASSLSARGIHSLLTGLYTMFFLKLEGSSSLGAVSPSGFVQPPACR